jgi:hypothetical protein
MSWFAISARSGDVAPRACDPGADVCRPSGARAGQGIQANRTGARAFRLVAPVVALGALCGACSDLYLDRRETIALSAGDAVATDKAVQIIDPWPPGSHNRRITSNGERMQAAVERYRTNRVTQPRSMTTSTVTPASTAGAAVPGAVATPGAAAPAPATSGQY